MLACRKVFMYQKQQIKDKQMKVNGEVLYYNVKETRKMFIKNIV